MVCLNCGFNLDLGAKFCTHCGKETNLANPNKEGKITIIRLKKVFAFIMPFDVYIDGTKLGVLTNNSTLSCAVTFGNHEVVFKSTEKDVIQNVFLSEDKKEVTITIIPKLGLIAARPFIKEVKYSEAENETK